MPQFALCLFWIPAGFTVYTYAAYPLLIAAWGRLRPRPPRRQAGFQPGVSIVLACHNEAENLPGRVANLMAQNYPRELVELIIVSDGSTDSTPGVMNALAREHAPRVKALALEQNGGKAVALNAGIAQATGDLIVFADARQRFEPDVLTRLAENFADPEVAAVSGELMFAAGDPEAAAANAQCAGQNAGEAPAPGIAAPVGMYWRYEKWMRRNESAIGSMLGATGAIYAIRRALYRPLPPGTLLDDFLTPMRLTLAGHRCVFDGRARAWDRPSTRAGQEFKRKARTLAGNYQAFALEPGLLLPWANPATWFQVWSHKLFRLWVPFALALALAASAALAVQRPAGFYALCLLGQIAFHAMAAWGWLRERAGRPMPGKLASLAYTFTVMNLAAAAGLWIWARGGNMQRLWKKAYTEAADNRKAQTSGKTPRGSA